MFLELIAADIIRQIPLEKDYCIDTVNYLFLEKVYAWYQRGMVDSAEDILKHIKQ
ncbi:hypothetical protein STRINF_00709 [Streptococcus infantarius subsp. infantarius ATCC BAA-102]|uniref:Uncharacterized protein n=1 Tax=Streptococcus infantarius subsp. infantarius ATCC BAA-102 TaxID=471872 RepID=A0ABP2DJB4_9STRE|nr:hypothetical protein STRINF_00709 [Streptococcus infantarius subsp. infantarius ATCC BAA-102]